MDNWSRNPEFWAVRGRQPADPVVARAVGFLLGDGGMMDGLQLRHFRKRARQFPRSLQAVPLLPLMVAYHEAQSVRRNRQARRRMGSAADLLRAWALHQSITDGLTTRHRLGAWVLHLHFGASWPRSHPRAGK